MHPTSLNERHPLFQTFLAWLHLKEHRMESKLQHFLQYRYPPRVKKPYHHLVREASLNGVVGAPRRKLKRRLKSEWKKFRKSWEKTNYMIVMKNVWNLIRKLFINWDYLFPKRHWVSHCFEGRVSIGTVPFVYKISHNNRCPR